MKQLNCSNILLDMVEMLGKVAVSKHRDSVGSAL
jgi:hypothetical protein